MGKTLLALTLLLSSGIGMAWWTPVDKAVDGSIYYADFDTIQKSDDKARISTLWDYRKVHIAGNHKYSSSKSEMEYNCKEAQSREISAIWYSENMAEGDAVFFVAGPTPWHPVTPGSTDEILLQTACRFLMKQEK